MEQLFKSDIKRIKEASLNDKLVIFVGAGVSRNSGVPSWWELIDTIKKELPSEIDKKESDFLKVAQLYRNSREKKEYIESVSKILRHGSVVPNPINDIIFDLKPSHVVTTNYDDLLEQTIANNNLQFYKINKDKDLPYAKYSKLLIKMHGDFEEGNIVLTEDDYLNYADNFPLTESYVRSLFASKLVLFIGFSFDDYNLKIITNRVKNLLGDDFQYMYLLNIGDTNHLYKEYYKKRGVKIIDYDKSIDNEIKNSVSTNALEKLSNSTGQKLYKLIHYINNFDVFKEENKTKHIIDQLYNAKQYYFDELKEVGGYELKKFYPFNNDEEFNFSHFTLYTSIPQINGLRDKLTGDFTEKRKFIEKYGKKYDELICFAKTNGIINISKVAMGQQKAIRLSNKKQNIKYGLDYLYDLKFVELHKYIDKLKAKESDDATIMDLELPFLLYRIGEFYESYLIYKRLANKFWKKEKYILYFLCQYNRRNMAREVESQAWFNSSLDFSTVKEIKDAVKKIDFEDVLSKIQVKSIELNRILKNVYSFQNVHSELYDSDVLLKKIKESNLNASNGGTSMNSFVQDLFSQVYQLWSFTNFNYIVSEHYTDHKIVYKKAFEGFIASHSIPTVEKESRTERQSSKLDKISIHHIYFIIFNADYKFITKVFNDYKVDHIKFDNKSLESINEMIVNAINSYRISNNNALQRTIEHSIQNLLLILSKTNISEEQVNTIIEKIISNELIDITEFSKPIEWFVSLHSEKISVTNLESLFEFSITRSKRELPPDLINNIVKILSEEIRDFSITDKTIINSILNIDIGYGMNNMYVFGSVYKYVSEDVQVEISRIINNRLMEHFDSFLLAMAYRNEIQIEEKLILKFVNKIIKPIVVSNANYFRYTLFLMSQDSSIDPDIIKQIRRSSSEIPFMNFLFNIEEFEDYKSFSVDWLRYLKTEQCKVLSHKTEIKDLVKKEIQDNPNNENIVKQFLRCF